MTLSAGADTREDLAEMLDHIASEMTNNPGLTNSTIGGVSYGAHYDIFDRGEEFTPERFKRELRAWMTPAEPFEPSKP